MKSTAWPGVARWNFQKLVDLKQCDVVQSSQLQSSAPAPATPVATGDTDLPPSAVQLQSQQSSAVVFNLPAAPVPTTLAMKGETFEDSQMDTDMPCTPPLPDSLTQKCIYWANQD
ncbi:hypothetical protein J4Q44_G00258010 [Coregonus suidteri]|uniref:Uncharacterized protein n=1 Tax=Coregonus suidteri TaxID=861788 RepID=A0AAN8L206_9TELE